jgi:hypothetical protein
VIAGRDALQLELDTVAVTTDYAGRFGEHGLDMDVMTRF